MKPKEIIAKFFVATASDTKNKIKKCKFCDQKYSLNVTRMTRHLLQCVKTPANTKAEIKKRHRDSKKDAILEDPDHTKSVREISEARLEEDGDLEIQNYTSCCPSPTQSTSTNTDSNITRTSINNYNNTVGTGGGGGGGFHKNASLLSSFVDHITESEQNYLWELFARAIYATGTPLNITENKYWKEFFKRIRPAFKLPSRFQLSTRLLDREFKKIEIKVREQISAASVYGIQIDGWSNIRNDSILNIIITTPTPVVFKSIHSASHGHTGEYLAKQVMEVLKEIGKERCLGLTTDNAAAMKKMWKVIQEDPSFKDLPIAFYSCIAHTLNLLIQDIISKHSCEEYINNAKSIVKSINNSHILKALLNEIQMDKYNKKKALKLPVNTRWGSIVDCFQSLIDSKVSIQNLAVSEKATLDREVKYVILNDEFWLRVEEIIELLKPIKIWIHKLESDTPLLFLVPKAMKEIKKHVNEILRNITLFSMSEQSAINEAVDKRITLALHPIHFAANILHPSYQGKDLSKDEDIAGVELIYKISSFLPEVDSSTIITELGQYRAREDLWNKEFVWTAIFHDSPSTWWKGICGVSMLSKVAAAILALPSSSAATERSFSTFAFIHNAKRNKLTNTRASKLLFIVQNLKTLNKTRSESKDPLNLEQLVEEEEPDQEIDKNDDTENITTLGADCELHVELSDDDLILYIESDNDEENNE